MHGFTDLRAARWVCELTNGNNGSKETVYTDVRKEFKNKRRVMKKFVTASTKIGLLVLLSIAAVAASAKAQSGSGLKANIPFDFTVAGKKFAAGHYSIDRASQSNGDLVLQISGLDNHSTVFPITNPVETLTARDKSVLIFHRYGDEYFLAQVWRAGATPGRAFTQSHRERQLEQEQRVATNNSVMVETVTLTF